MFFDRLQNFLKGFVVFTARGGFPERFINLCWANNVEIKNIRTYKENITASCGIKDYRKIRQVAKKSGMKVRIIKKTGLPFWLHKKRKRQGVLWGLIFFAVMTYFLSGFVWCVDVNGNENIPKEDILASFKTNGVKTGMKKDDFLAEEISRKVLTQNDSLMWAAVNIDGCKITIEVKEMTPPHKESTEDKPSNIIAEKSGQITLIENFLGTPLTEVGSAVEKGDILVSGAVTNKDETVSFYKAEANVIARTHNTITSRESAVREMRVYGKVKNKNYISFFGITFPVNFIFNKGESYTFSEAEKFLCVEDKRLPAGIITQRFGFYKKEKVTLTESAVKLISAEEYFRCIDETLNTAKVENVVHTVNKGKDFYEITSVFRCIENIGVRKNMDIKFENADG